jgi:hypothetical protein
VVSFINDIIMAKTMVVKGFLLRRGPPTGKADQNSKATVLETSNGDKGHGNCF